MLLTSNILMGFFFIQLFQTYPVYFPSTKTEVTKYGNLYLRLEEFNTDHTTIVRKFLLSKTSVSMLVAQRIFVFILRLFTS